MPVQNSIAIDKLVRLIDTANAPAIIDLRSDEGFARFVPQTVLLYVFPSDVFDVAAQFGGAAYDREGKDVFWSHRGERRTFDLVVEALGLGGIEPPAHKLAKVRA